MEGNMGEAEVQSQNWNFSSRRAGHVRTFSSAVGTLRRKSGGMVARIGNRSRGGTVGTDRVGDAAAVRTPLAQRQRSRARAKEAQTNPLPAFLTLDKLFNIAEAVLPPGTSRRLRVTDHGH